MQTNTKHFARNPLEICLLCFCCIIFVYLLNVSKQIQQRQEAIIHQYLTFAGYAVRESFELSPIISPDYVVWNAEEPFLEEEARLTTIIDVSIEQLTNGILPEDGKEGDDLVPLGQNQRAFVEQRLEDAAIEGTRLNNERMIAMTAAKKERDALLEQMVEGRYKTVLEELNQLFEMNGPFFFVYYKDTDTLYTDSLVKEDQRFQVMRLLKMQRTVATSAHISLIKLSENIRLGAYMPANYSNPIVLKIVRESIPTIALILVIPCVICSFFATSFVRAHKQKELLYRIKRATHLAQVFDEVEKIGKKKRKRYHDFRAESPIDLALYGASGRDIVDNHGTLVNEGPVGAKTSFDTEEAIRQLGGEIRNAEGAGGGQGQGQGQAGKRGKMGAFGKLPSQPMELLAPRSVLYGAHWVQNFLCMETTPIRKQLDRHTKIPTRTMFLQIMQELWIKKTYLHAPIYLAHVDVDNLEEANRLLGYTAGNHIIFNMIEIMREKLGKNGLIGRLSSDNFICLYVGNEEDFISIITSTLIAINEMAFDGSSIHTPSASIGVTEILESDNNIDDGQRRALAALYQAKNDGKNCYRKI